MSQTIKIMEWNIHGAGGYGNYAIPNFVADTILYQKVDIAIIVEFVAGKQWDYLKKTLEKTYNLFLSPYISERNQVMIALKKETGFSIKRVLTENPLEKEKPESLQIEAKLDSTSLAIMGVRIKTQGTKEQIASQFEFLKDHLKSLKNTNVLCAGDFNVWKKPLSKKLGIISDNIFTPKYAMEFGDFNTLDTWSAVIRNPKTDVVGKALIDHIVTIGIEMHSDSIVYDWSFVTNGNGYGNRKPEDYKSDLIGLPDHAILFAEFELPNNK
ncbi:MAG: endonuclease/exonuclease/phosphatase family protein [Intestinimonas sp.]|jgi:exonuclease III|nr:endonuclease/exonuclease/phosphatase family protein [Intestinimonas sp.]